MDEFGAVEAVDSQGEVGGQILPGRLDFPGVGNVPPVDVIEGDALKQSLGGLGRRGGQSPADVPLLEELVGLYGKIFHFEGGTGVSLPEGFQIFQFFGQPGGDRLGEDFDVIGQLQGSLREGEEAETFAHSLFEEGQIFFGHGKSGGCLVSAKFYEKVSAFVKFIKNGKGAGRAGTALDNIFLGGVGKDDGRGLEIIHQL